MVYYIYNYIKIKKLENIMCDKYFIIKLKTLWNTKAQQRLFSFYLLIKKRLVLFFYIFIIFLNFPVLIKADIDYVQLPSTSHDESISGDAQGSSGNTRDGNFDSYYGAYRHHGGDGSASCSITSTHTWTIPTHINSIKFKLYARPYPHGNYEQQIYTLRVELRISGSWTTVDEDSGNYHASTPGHAGHHWRDLTLSTGWDNVSGIRCYSYAWAYSYEGDRQQQVWASVYEVQAWGGVEPTVITSPAINIQQIQATLVGDITDIGSENCDIRGFEWGISSGSYSYNWTQNGSYGTGTFNHIISGLSPGIAYYFRAMAHNSAGWGHGTERSFITDPLITPVIIQCDTVSQTEIDIRWNNIGNETSYTLFRNTINNLGTASKIAGRGTDITNYHDSGLLTGQIYYYWVRAYCTGSPSGYSPVASTTTLNIPAPYIMQCDAISKNEIQIKWENVNNETSYTLYRNTESEVLTAQIITGTTTDITNYTDTGLESGCTYYYWVRSFNNNDSSVYSTPSYTTTFWLQSKILYPLNKTYLSLNDSIYGNANSKGLDLNNIKVRIKDPDKNEYWNGLMWVIETNTWLETSGIEDWKYKTKDIKWEYGKTYHVQSCANGLNGIIEENIAWHEFIVIYSDDLRKSFVNYPNPFFPDQGKMIIEYYLEKAQDIKLWIFAINGEIVKKFQFARGQLGAMQGLNKVEWDGRNNKNFKVGNGLYFCKLQYGNITLQGLLKIVIVY